MKNDRTFLEKLLDGAEVEWKPLKKLCNFISTGKLNANAMEENGIYPFFTCNEKPYKINSYAFDMEAILISGNGSQVGHLNYFKGKFNAYQRTYVIGDFSNNILVMYLYHYLNFKLRNYITINSKKGSVPYITLPMLENFEVPIPPLPVQTEIVRILDALTALTNELTNELTLRQKQYQYYQGKLLDRVNKVKWEPLGKLTSIKTGQSVSKNSISQNPGIYPVINSGREPLGFINEWNTENDPIGITTRGAGVGSITWQEGKYFRGNLNYSVTIKSESKLTVRFLYYILRHFQKEIHSLCSFTGIPALNASELKKLLIPIPPLKEQQYIVSILDKFDGLTNSITEGLPLAIEQSQNRYEYYREMLLNFPKSN